MTPKQAIKIIRAMGYTHVGGLGGRQTLEEFFTWLSELPFARNEKKCEISGDCAIACLIVGERSVYPLFREPQ